MIPDLKVELSDEFAVRIINLYKYLIYNRKETVMSKQILRSGTSIGANVAESIYAESLADFEHKLRISLKEASETLYWLRLLRRTDYISQIEYNSMTRDCNSIKNILSSIVRNIASNK
jgi:four helix bundle protein